MADETDAPLMFDDIPSFDDMPDAPTQPQASGASSSPLMFDDIPSFDDMKDENRPQAEGQVGTFAREAAHAALPAAGGMLAAGAAGALGGAALGPVGAIAGGIGGMIIGSMATDKAQQWSLEQLGMDDSAQRAANAEENPYTAFAGGLAPAVATMSPVKGLQAAQRGIGAGMMGGFEAGQEYLQEGKVDPLKVAGAATVGAVLPQANRAGEALMGAGARVAGRPNAHANPAAEPVQDEAASSQQPTVTGDNSLAQPAPSNDGDTIGNPQSRSTTGDIGRDQTKGKSAPDAEGNSLTQGETDPTIRTAMESWLGEEPGGGKPEPQITASEPDLPIHTGIEEAHQQAVAAAAPQERIHTGIEGAAASQAPQAAAPTTVGEFKTSKGSQYQLHEDGSTTRNKSVHPEHPGDEGPKPKSEKTYYLTGEQARALAPPQGKFRIIDHGNGTLSTATPSSGDRWGIASSQRGVGPVETQPQHGLHPLELWAGSVSKQGDRGYNAAHFGNEVTEINGRAREEAVPGGESRPQEEVAPAPVAEHVPAFDAIPETATEGVKPTRATDAIVGYHGSRDVMDKFDPSKTRLDRGVFFAEHPEVASKFAEGRAVDGDPARIYGDDTPQEIVRWVEEHAGASEAKRIKALIDEAERLDWDKNNDKKSALSETINAELTKLTGLDQSFGDSSPNVTMARINLGKNHKVDMGGKFDWGKEGEALAHARRNGFDSVTFTNTGEKGNYHSILNRDNIHPYYDANTTIPETATEGVKPEPKVVTAAVTKMRENGVPEDAIAKFNALDPSAKIAEASKYVNGRKNPGEMARPDRIRSGAPVVEGIKTDEGKPVTARDKADAARKSADVKTMNDAHEALGKIEVPTTPEEKAALKARLQTFLDATKGVTYKPALKHEPYVIQRAAKKLLTAKNPSEKSWNTFVSDALVGDEARATQRIEADIGRNKRSGDEAITGAEAKLAEHNDVEDVAIENVNLERATRAIKELDQYFRGDREREDLSAKAQKTLSAMPPEIRKGAFDAEPDSPEATKVAGWLRNHFTEPQETPVKTARDIKRIEPAAHIDATTPEGQKALDKVLSKAPEEPKASEVRKIKPDAKMLADILERSKQADAKNKAKAPESEAPPQVKTKAARDLFDVFSKDEGGKLDFDGIMADVTAALKKTGYAAKKNFWQPKGKDSYIARTPKSPQEEYARSLSDDLQKVRQGDIDHKLGLMQLVDRLPKALNNPKALEQIYLARESGKISSLPPFLQRLYEQHLEPIFKQNDTLFDNIQKLAPDRIGPEVKDHVYRILKGDTSENNILKTGESTDPIEGVNAISTAQRGPALNRRFVALERQDGKRFVIALNDNGFTIWKNGSPQRIVDPTFNYKAGDKLTVGKNTFTMKEAMTPEIEAHAKMDGGKSAEYYHNAALSATAANAYLGSMARHLQYLETLKKDPAFTRYAAAPGSKAPSDWVTTSLPNFKDWKMDPQLSHVMNDYAQPGFNEANLNFMRRLSQAVTKTIFWLPTAHINNVGGHWFVGRGWDWITPKGYQGLVVDGAKAIKSVISQDAFQSQMREHGAGSIYGGVLTQNFMEKLGKAAGEDIKRNPSKWDPIAKTLGVGPSDLARAIYNGSSKMMWAANDMFLTHTVMENMRKGMDMSEAIQHAERHIPNYRVPTTVLNGGRSGRIMSQIMQDPLVTSFGRYHYGVYNSYAHMVKDLVQGDGHRKLEAVGNLMALGIMAFAVKPLFDTGAKYLTGNDKAEVQSRGPLGPLHHVVRSGEALSDPMQFARSTVTIPPLTSTILETLFNKDWRGKSIIEPGTFSKAAHGSVKDMGRVAVQEGEHALRGLVSPVGTAESVAAKDITPAGGLRDQALDIRNPSAAQKKYEANIAKTSAKAVKSRFKKPPGQLEKAYNKTFGY
jgi:hypothetical protein